MKIIIKTNDFFKVFPQYEEDLTKSYEKYIELLEKNEYNIDKIENKEIFTLQLGTKVDFGFKVSANGISNSKTNAITIQDNYQWEIKNYDIKSLTALMLRDETIILDWDTKNIDNVELLDYLAKKYNINAQEYETKNYIGEGSINWDTITEDVKKNWDNSYFFLDNMNDEKFVKSNQKLILEKTKNNQEILKEALSKSTKFFEYALDNIALDKMLITMKDNPKILALIWNTKIKELFKKCNYSIMINEIKENMNEELENYRVFVRENYNRYEDEEEIHRYESLRDRLRKEFKLSEIELKKEVENNQLIKKEIIKVLEDNELKYNTVCGLLKTDISKEDFIYFEDYIINNEALKEIVINKGLYKSLATNKKFIEALNNTELLKFVETCNNNIQNSIFSSEDKRHFSRIVSEDKLLAMFENNKETIPKLNILSHIESKNKNLKKYLFKNSPKERFSELKENEIREEDIRLYLQDEGYIETVQRKYNLYELKEIETIKLVCEKSKEFLSNKHIPNNWKINPEIIRTILIKHNSLKESKLSVMNVLELSKDRNLVKEIVSKDRSYSFYKLLPEKLKNDKKVVLSFLEVYGDIKEIIENLPPFILLDKNFNIALINKSSKAIKYINNNIWNDKQFVLTLFSEIEGTYKEAEVRKELPEKIQFFLETFNVKENLYTFFNNYYLQKKLEEKVIEEDPKKKIKRSKI